MEPREELLVVLRDVLGLGSNVAIGSSVGLGPTTLSGEEAGRISAALHKYCVVCFEAEVAGLEDFLSEVLGLADSARIVSISTTAFNGAIESLNNSLRELRATDIRTTTLFNCLTGAMKVAIDDP